MPTDGGTLAAKRGRFGPFVGCSRYPDCDYIKKDGPPPPEPLPFEVVCPRCKEGRLTPRRARRTGSLFWGCSRYPNCDFTTSHEPLGATHDADAGPVARKGDEAAMCLLCGADDGPAGGLDIVPGTTIPGGPPDPAALARPSRGGRGSRSGAGRAAAVRRSGGPAARADSSARPAVELRAAAAGPSLRPRGDRRRRPRSVHRRADRP